MALLAQQRPRSRRPDARHGDTTTHTHRSTATACVRRLPLLLLWSLLLCAAVASRAHVDDVEAHTHRVNTSQHVRVTQSPSSPLSSTSAPATREQRVRALQQQLRAASPRHTLPLPPREWGVHTACLKFAKACPSAYVTFLEQQMQQQQQQQSTQHVSNDTTHATPTRTTAVQHDIDNNNIDDDDDDDKAVRAMRRVSATWSYAQRAHIEDLRHVAAALERQLRVTTACALLPSPSSSHRRRDAHAHALRVWLRTGSSSSSSNNDDGDDDTTRHIRTTTTATTTTMWSRVRQHASTWCSVHIRCAWWHYGGVRCACVYGWRVWLYTTLARLGDAVAWAQQQSSSYVVLPSLSTLLMAVVLCAVCLRIAVGAPLPRETVAQLQRAHATLRRQHQRLPQQQKQQECATTRSSSDDNAMTIHDGRHAAAGSGGDATASDVDAQLARFARCRALVVLHGIVDEHAEVQHVCVYLRVQLAMYALALIALLGTSCLIMAHAHDTSLDVTATLSRLRHALRTIVAGGGGGGDDAHTHVSLLRRLMTRSSSLSPHGRRRALPLLASSSWWRRLLLLLWPSRLALSLSAALGVLCQLPLVFLVGRTLVHAHAAYAELQHSVAQRRSKALMHLVALTSDAP